MMLLADLSAAFDSLASFVANYWLLLALISFGGASNYLNLPKGERTTERLGLALGLLSLPTTVYLLLGAETPFVETAIYYFFTLLMFIGAGSMVSKSNPAHGALLFALALLGACGLFLVLGAPFLMAATLIIYAGAIVVTFLFVIMLAHQSGVSTADHLSREPFLSTLTTAVLLGSLAFMLSKSVPSFALDAALANVDRAARVNTMKEIDEILTSPQEFSKAFEAAVPDVTTLVAKDRATRAHLAFHDALNGVRKQWGHQDAASMKAELRNAYQAGLHLRAMLGQLHAPEGLPVTRNLGTSAGEQPRPLPAANVAGLGKALFTDYLLAVELAGVLLLVATIGALAIANRREEATS